MKIIKHKKSGRIFEVVRQYKKSPTKAVFTELLNTKTNEIETYPNLDLKYFEIIA